MIWKRCPHMRCDTGTHTRCTGLYSTHLTGFGDEDGSGFGSVEDDAAEDVDQEPDDAESHAMHNAEEDSEIRPWWSLTASMLVSIM